MEQEMFEGDYVKWGTWSADDWAGQVYIELLKNNYTAATLLGLIEELMAIRDKLRTRKE